METKLGHDEKIIMEAKIHPITIVLHTVLVFFIVGIITLPGVIVNYFTTQLTFTNRRLIGKTGWINTKQIDAPLNKINNISVSSGLIGKMFGYGNVVISTSSTTYLYKNVMNADNFRIALMEQIDLFGNGGTERIANIRK